MMYTTFCRFYLSFPGGISLIGWKFLREILDRYQIFIIDFVLFSDQRLYRRGPILIISCSQCTRLSFLIIQFKDIGQFRIRAFIPETTQGIIMPEYSIPFGGNDKRNAYFRIVLEQFFVFSFIIELVALMLPQTVQSFLFVIFKNLTERIAIGSFHPYRGEFFPTSILFTEDQVPCFIREPDFTCSL